MRVIPKTSPVTNPPGHFTGDAWVDSLVALQEDDERMKAHTPPGQEHGHAATAADFREHLAMVDKSVDPATTTTWLERTANEDPQKAQEA